MPPLPPLVPPRRAGRGGRADLRVRLVRPRRRAGLPEAPAGRVPARTRRRTGIFPDALQPLSRADHGKCPRGPRRRNRQPGAFRRGSPAGTELPRPHAAAARNSTASSCSRANSSCRFRRPMPSSSTTSRPNCVFRKTTPGRSTISRRVSRARNSPCPATSPTRRKSATGRFSAASTPAARRQRGRNCNILPTRSAKSISAARRN